MVTTPDRLHGGMMRNRYVGRSLLATALRSQSFLPSSW
jgi:hypothetical protein